MAVLLLVIGVESASIAYDTIISFGDSNTDTGNVLRLTNGSWPIPPFYQGRFSDGPVWIDRLALPNVWNNAYGGATSDNNLVLGYSGLRTPVPGVRQQILQYKNRSNASPTNLHRTIFTIWVGANDYFRNSTLLPSQVVPSVMNSVQDLIDLGAKHFLIMNQPPFHRQPVASALNNTALLSMMISTHNRVLSESIQSLRNRTATVAIHLVDIYSLIDGILNNLSFYGINNTNQCWLVSSSGVVQLYNNTDNAIFIDQYHYTTRVHRYIGDHVRSLISSNGMPLIFSWSLLFICIFLS